MFGLMAQYGVLGACLPNFDLRYAIHHQLGCLEASRGQNRGQK